MPPRRQRPLAYREIVAWTVAALTGGVIAAAITITGIAASAADDNAPVSGARAVAVAPLTASPTSGLGSREPPRTEPTTAPAAIPLAALPKADPPKASGALPTPAASARSKITATARTPKAKATAAKTKTASQTSTTTRRAKATVSGKVKKSTE